MCDVVHPEYTVDTVPSKDPKEVREMWNKTSGSKCSVKHGVIPEQIQHALWEQPTCANTKLIPGKLSICISMSIMIHNNAATEMCIMKGREGVVYAWQSHKLPNNKDVIDTLFV